MILKHETTSKMIKEFFSVIEKRITKNNNNKLWKCKKLETVL